MARRAICIWVAIFTILMFSGCSTRKLTQAPPSKEESSGSLTPPDSNSQQEGSSDKGSNSGGNVDEISEQIKSMSLDEKIGQMVISGVDAYTNDEHSRELIEKYHVGGFIILGQNVKDANQVVSLLNSLKDTNVKSGNKLPLFLSVDQEGGKIERMPAGIERFPTNKAIGQINSSAYSYSIGKALGQEVKAFGYNLDFAPVLDINSNPKNPVIGDRSFGADSQLVIKLGMETMKGIRSENIISAVKHFPGHGDTSVDSHTGLPVVNNDLTRLRSFELLPFEEAIKNDADMIMVAHILFPKIDAANPSSMSKTIITDILRNSLNYNGVVITDDMTMGAIMENYDIGDAAVKSVAAGCDIVLVCHEFEKEVKVISALKEAVLNGTIPEETIDRSVYRILKLKQKYNLTDKAVKSIDVNAINNLISKTISNH